MAGGTEDAEVAGEKTPESRPPPVQKRGRRLGSLANVRTALADVVRKLESDQMDAGKARALIYGLSTLADAIRQSDLEARISALEGRKT